MNTVEYLITKLEELGINDFFGVPGDYNFEILNAIEDNPKTNWIGCTNELNAGYAADGYARERGLGALVTTYGVGELSAINAIAGSFAENVPVIHIVGTPNTKSLSEKTCSHHNFQPVEPFIYAETFKNVTQTIAFLNRDNAKLEIDRLLKVFIKERKPVYIAIPMDITQLEISQKDIDYNWSSDKETLEIVSEKIIEKLNKSQHPVILGDILIKRFDAQIEYQEFVEKSGIPTANLLMGTNLISLDLKNNLGTFFAGYKNLNAKKYIDESDCLISIGIICGSFNSFGADLSKKIKSQIAIYGTHTIIDNIQYNDVKMSELLDLLSSKIEYKNFSIEKTFNGYAQPQIPNGKLTSEYIYSRLQEYLKENDILVAETGTITYGVSQIKFPNNTELITQSLWASIGWATAATLGIAKAKTEQKVVLFTGEGAHQISAMELGTMLKHGLKPIIIVLNNRGYTIERVLSENFDAKYNDIVEMSYSKFARVFEGNIWSTKIETQDDFDKALKVTQIMNKLCYLEIVTEPDDIPELAKCVLSDLRDNTQKENKEIALINNSIKSVSKISEDTICFTTKVHESLK